MIAFPIWMCSGGLRNNLACILPFLHFFLSNPKKILPGVQRRSVYLCCHGNMQLLWPWGCEILTNGLRPQRPGPSLLWGLLWLSATFLLAYSPQKSREAKEQRTICLIRRSREDSGEEQGVWVSAEREEVLTSNLFHYVSGPCSLFCLGYIAHATYMLNLTCAEWQKGTKGKERL